MVIKITNNVATINQAVSPLFTVGSGGVGVSAAASAGATAAAPAAGAASAGAAISAAGAGASWPANAGPMSVSATSATPRAF